MKQYVSEGNSCNHRVNLKSSGILTSLWDVPPSLHLATLDACSFVLGAALPNGMVVSSKYGSLRPAGQGLGSLRDQEAQHIKYH